MQQSNDTNVGVVDGATKRKRQQKKTSSSLTTPITKTKPPVKKSKQERMNYCKLLKDRGFTLCDKLASWHEKTGHDFLLVMRSRPIPTATNSSKSGQQQQRLPTEFPHDCYNNNDHQHHHQQQQTVSSNIAIKSDAPEVRAGVIQLPNTAEWVVMSSVQSPTSESFTKFYTQLIMPAMTQVFKTVTPHNETMSHINEVVESRIKQERLIAEKYPEALNDPQRLQDLKKETRSELVLPQVANFIYPDLFPHLFTPEGTEPNILFPFSRGVANKSLDPDELSEIKNDHSHQSSHYYSSSTPSSYSSSDDESNYMASQTSNVNQDGSSVYNVNLPYPSPEELVAIMQQYNNSIGITSQ